MVYFQTQNPNLGKCWRGLGRLENVDIFNGYLEYFTDIWDMWCIFYALCTKKNLATLM
jgi:hypothetical protein